MFRVRCLIALATASLFLISSPGYSQTAWPTPAQFGGAASGSVAMCLNGSSQAVPCSTVVPLQIAGTFSATLGGFAPAGTFATLTATASSASVALPAGAVVIFQNTGTTAVSCTLGVGSATATASQNIVQAASWLALTVGSNTFGACIDVTGSASNLVVLTGGAGLPTGAGGGAGGGGAVTNAGTFAVQAPITSWGGGTLGAMANYGTSPGAVLVPGINAFVTNTNANGQAVAAASSPVVLPAAQVTADPCALGNKTNLPISQSGTSSVQLVALSGSTVIYVCSLSLIAAGATTVVLTTGTGSACVTGNAAVIGDTTANIANGLSLAANGGLTLGNGSGTIAKGAASSELCMTLGTNVRMSGNLTYVQQ